MKEKRVIYGKGSKKTLCGMLENLHQLQFRQRANIQNSQRISEIKYQGNKNVNQWANELNRQLSK